ncbi:serine/threonine-protein kinase [Streptomyces sp. DSM 15324]|uniref:serine/threonine-protein kinase n=1 Tax=Streptomyces sp. DSM 15324 TaxID=1739111 RepID=UPI000A9172D8|nr:serine/threonine-protein kinase [Streptomyces sp. DSM 15324]
MGSVAGVEIAGRYRLEVLLGRGGMGEVWRAVDPVLGRRVAIKFLPSHLTAGGPHLERFRREARVTARLQHPGIAQVFDYGTHAGQPFLVMELLDGRNLGEVMREHPSGLPVHKALDLAAQVADALSCAHRADVVHRDIKPANLMLLTGDRLKVCDFGIAGVVEADSDLTQEGTAIGTPAYMAPEQCLGERVDGRADLYALGCVLFVLLTGRTPFPADGDFRAVMLRHIHTPPPPLGSVRTDLPDGIGRLVARLLVKDPAERPGFAGSVADQLRALREGRAPDMLPDRTAPVDRVTDPTGSHPADAPRGATVPPGVELSTYHLGNLAAEATEFNLIVTVTDTTPTRAAVEAGTAPAVVFLLGMSTELPEEDFDAVKTAVAAAIDALDDGVSFAVVAGSAYAQTLYPDSLRLVTATAVTKAEASAALARLRPIEAAALGRWLRLADRLFSARPEAARCAILLTDMQADAESSEEFAAALTSYAERFPCHVRGIGSNWSVRQLSSIASTTLRGSVDIVVRPAEDLAEDLVKIVERLSGTPGRELALRITAAGGQVRSFKQVIPTVEEVTDRGYPTGPDTVEYPVEAGAGTALDPARDYHVQLRVPAGPPGEETTMADLEVILLPPAGDGQVLARQSVRVVRTETAPPADADPAE